MQQHAFGAPPADVNHDCRTAIGAEGGSSDRGGGGGNGTRENFFAMQEAVLAMQMRFLHSMGFTDAARNRSLLVAHEGDLNATVEELQHPNQVSLRQQPQMNRQQSEGSRSDGKARDEGNERGGEEQQQQ